MPKKLGNGGVSMEAYNPQDGKYTDEGNISQEEREAMNLLGLNKTNSGNFTGSSYNKENIKKDFTNNGYVTEEGTATFDDIYSDYVKKNKKEPSSLEEIIEFVKQEVHNHFDEGYKKGYDYDYLQYEMPYYVKRQAVSAPDIPKKENAVAVPNPTEKTISPGSYVTKTGPSFKIDVGDGANVDPGFINDKIDPNFKPRKPLFRIDMPAEEKTFDEIYKKLFNGGKQ